MPRSSNGEGKGEQICSVTKSKVTEEMSLDRYSQIEEHQAGSQKQPGFHRKAWDQVHGHRPLGFPPLSVPSAVCAALRVWRSPCCPLESHWGLRFKCWERRWGWSCSQWKSPLCSTCRSPSCLERWQNIMDTPVSPPLSSYSMGIQ